MKTIDVTSRTQKVEQPKTWTQVANHLSTHPSTIKRYRDALGRHDEPPSPNLIEWLSLMNKWCNLGGGGRGGEFTYQKFQKYLKNGQLEGKLKRFGIIQENDTLPNIPQT